MSKRISTKEKLKHHYEKNDSEILIILYNVNLCNQNLKLHERSCWEKHYPISEQVFYDKTIEKLTTTSCFD